MLSGIKKQLRSLTLLLLIFLIPATVHAVDVTGALWTSNITFINVAIPLTEIQAPFEMSGSSLVDGSFMTSNAFNSALQSGGLDFPSMPASDRIRVLGAVAEDGGSFTDETTEANNSTFADVTLLPAAPAVNDAYYFIMDNPGRVITLNIGQGGVGTWDLAWEYWDGSTYSEITGSAIDDRTDNFTVFGVNTVSFDMPIDWEKRAVEGIDGYIIRARVTTFTSLSTQPLATQLWYETGLWWTWIDVLDEDDQRNFVLYLGGPAMQDHHQIFLSNEGITTVDDPSIEPGLTYAFQIVGRLDFRIPGACIVCKGEEFTLTTTGTSGVTLSVTGSGGQVLTVSGISLPVTGAHIIGVDSDVTDLTLSVTPGGSVVGTAQNIPDNSTGYTFSSSGAMIYLESIAMTTTGLFGEFFSFNSEAEWDTGVIVDLDTVGGSHGNFTHRYYPSTGTDEGMWREDSVQFFNCPTVNFTEFGFLSAFNGPVNAFYRFDNIQIAQGATITSASLGWWGITGTNDVVRTNISAIDSDDADAPSTFSEAENATRTTAFIAWDNVVDFNVIGADRIPSLDLASVVQEIVNRSGWVPGNAIVIYVEDDGSDTNTNTRRSADCWFSTEQGAELRIDVASDPVLANDFLELAESGINTGSLADNFNPNIVIGWLGDCVDPSFCSVDVLFDQHSVTDNNRSGNVFGSYALHLELNSSNGDLAEMFQDLTASAGEVWSLRQAHNRYSTGSVTSEGCLIWLDSSKVEISLDCMSLVVNISDFTFTNLDGITAPSGTAFVRVRYRHFCGGSCSEAGVRIDGVVACVCNPAPNFPDSANRITNPSFELVNKQVGTWTSPTINPLSTNVLTSAVFWTSIESDGFPSSQEDLIVSISTTAGAPFVVIAQSGDPIPGLNPGDDATQLGMQLRFTLYNTGSAPTNAECLDEAPECHTTPIVSEALVFLATEAGDDNTDLLYKLNTTPSFFIDDRSSNNNIGDLNLPLIPLLPLSFVGALQSTSPIVSQTQGGVGAPSFADQITPPVNTFPTGGTGSGLPLFAFFTLMSDLSGLPTTIFMLMVAMIVIIFAGVITFQAFNSTTVAYLTMMIAMIAFTFIDSGVIPWWIIVVFGLVGGFWVLKPRTSV